MPEAQKMENKKRLIWDEDAKRHLIALAVGHHTETLHIDMILNAILHHTPTVDAVEVVHARWENGHCTNCKQNAEVQSIGFNCTGGIRIDYKETNYCPNCGAKMDGGNEDA